MDSGVEEAFAAALGALAVTGVLLDVGDQAGIKNTLTIVGGIKTAIEVEVGASEVQPHLFGHLFQRFQALRQQDHVGLIDRRHRDRRKDVAMIVDDGNDLVALLMFVARVANPIAPFLATVLVPSPWSTVRSSCFWVRLFWNSGWETGCGPYHG